MLVASATWAQTDFSDVEIKSTKVAEGIYMLQGAGGNIGVSIGADGVILIDDQFAPLSEKIRAAVSEIRQGQVRFVLNTHWHGDHTGGNEALGQLGAVIVAHDNVRRRMTVEQFNEAFNRTTPASPPGALPVVTFTDTVTFHFNGQEIQAFHVGQAHTDGDSIVHFRKANVIHMGDVFFNERYPFIDSSSGGSIDGVIAAVEEVLSRTNDETRIIAGHGPLAGPAELRAYVDMLRTVRDRIAKMIDEGMSEEQVVGAKPTAEFDEARAGGFAPDRWVSLIYAGIKASAN
jgi:glyoxylase-like metal-dependent hydrolase (beta-lactamase superfamily II)